MVTVGEDGKNTLVKTRHPAERTKRGAGRRDLPHTLCGNTMCEPNGSRINSGATSMEEENKEEGVEEEEDEERERFGEKGDKSDCFVTGKLRH